MLSIDIKWLFIIMFFPSAVAWSAAVDLDADRVTRSADGSLTASGSARLLREDKQLSADTIAYHPAAGTVDLYGQVQLDGLDHTIRAERAHYLLDQQQGTLEQAQIHFTGGEHAHAARVEQLSSNHFRLHKAAFTSCHQGGAGGWWLRADEADLNRDAGVLIAHGVVFDLAGVPVLYSPYWQHPLRRKSGLLLPKIGFGKRRGNELALPLYWAPAANWDATITPHWMEARGLQGGIELRHASLLGSEKVQFEGVRDRQLGNVVRKAGAADIRWGLAPGLAFNLNGKYVGDRGYLADFSPDAINGSTRYLTSNATLAWQGLQGRTMLTAQRSQNLAAANDAATLQILPRLESHHRLPLKVNRLLFGLDQQTTNFARDTGSAGVRVVLAPYLELPWRTEGGGASALLHIGMHRADYRLRNGALPKRQHHNSYDGSLTVSADFERVSEGGLWRHQLSPTLRYDRVFAPNQSFLPQFDSGFARLNMSNLMQGNRFVGNDRVERTHRLSLLLVQTLQHKSTLDRAARALFQTAFGVSYDMLRQSVDPALQAAPIRPWSNLLGSLAWQPWQGVQFSADGQYDAANRYWAYSTLSAAVADGRGDRLQTAYRQADRRYVVAAESVESTVAVALTDRWRATGRWHYDLHQKLTRYANVALTYDHACWSLTLEGYQNRLQAATSNQTDSGGRIAFTLDGLGG
ncbi:MAG: LPS assembly protein LptD [Mariprofundales bacterium]